MERVLIELLLRCLHQEPDRVTTREIETLTEADWRALIGLAGQQGVPALFYHRLQTRGLSTAVPEPFLTVLRDQYKGNAIRNLRLFAGLNQVVKALHAEQIPVMVLKGAHLAQTVYGSLALRSMGDIDIMVPADRLGQAGDVLAGQGYRARSAYHVDAELAVCHHLPPFLKMGAPTIELHWHIMNPDMSNSITPEELWQTAVPVAMNGRQVLGLAPENLLLHVCEHASYHHRFQFGLRPYCDIAQIIQRFDGTLDWATVLRRAAAWRWQKGVCLALHLARELVGAAVPKDVFRALQPSAPNEEILSTVHRLMFVDRAWSRGMTEEAATVLAGNGWWSRLTGMAGRLFLSPRYIARLYSLPLHSWRVYAYYPVRLWDLVRRYRSVIWELYTGNRNTIALTRQKRTLADWLGDE